MEQTLTNGITRIRSRSDFELTSVRLAGALRHHNLDLIAVVDHTANARSTALAMPPTKLFIFGSPVAGTAVMLSFPSVAIDLPHKALVQEDPDGVWVSYNTPEYLQQRHGLSESLTSRLRGIRAVCEEAAA